VFYPIKRYGGYISINTVFPVAYSLIKIYRRIVLRLKNTFVVSTGLSHRGVATNAAMAESFAKPWSLKTIHGNIIYKQFYEKITG
jgi:hypothetical protein